MPAYDKERDQLTRQKVAASRVIVALLCSSLAGTAATVIAPRGAEASAASSRHWRVQKSQSPGSLHNVLFGVAATSATNAWAVGNYSTGTVTQTLIERWEGKGWKTQPSPNPGGVAQVNALDAVTAISATNAWAVGDFHSGSVDQTLVEHWNGKAWKVQKSPNAGGSASNNYLFGVIATSATNAWAVGNYSTGTGYKMLIEHWNGKVWKVQPSPSPGGSANYELLQAVAATSATNAWAVGDYYAHGSVSKTVVEHWNGKAWKVQSAPSPKGSHHSGLWGVAAISTTNVWAVGTYSANGTDTRTLVVHWNGKAWKVQPSPNPGGSHGTELGSVIATSPTNAWVIGAYSNGTASRTLVEHWNGKAWKVQPSPSPGGSQGARLSGVTATSATSAWAVGDYSYGMAEQTLVERCC